MRYLVLMADDGSAWAQATEAERAGVFEDHAAFDEALRDHGTLVSGDALAGADQARTLRTLGGTRVVTDGSCVETVEPLVGYYLIDVLDAHTAVDMCRILPENYTIEVRPTIDIEGYVPGDVA